MGRRTVGSAPHEIHLCLILSLAGVTWVIFWLASRQATNLPSLFSSVCLSPRIARSKRIQSDAAAMRCSSCSMAVPPKYSVYEFFKSFLTSVMAVTPSLRRVKVTTVFFKPGHADRSQQFTTERSCAKRFDDVVFAHNLAQPTTD
jgi:hypothetical protein